MSEKNCRYCDKPARRAGLCGMHHSRVLRGQDLDAPPLRMKCKGKACSSPGCESPAEKLMLCRNHYASLERSELGNCSTAGCENKEVFGRRGFCGKHYLAQYRAKNPKLCSLCKRPSIAKGLCAAHYSRSKRGFDMAKPLVPRYNGLACKHPGCARPAKGRGWCRLHYARHRDGVPLDAPPRAPTLKSYIDDWGYVKTVCQDGKRRSAHRMVMEEAIGRPLLKKETVHHKNGQRTDNRLVRGHELHCPGACCNLELWSRAQPSGQRVRDKVTWARELLELYGEQFPAEPRRKPKQAL